MILEWGLALLVLVVWLAAPGVDAGAGRAALAAGVARAGDRRSSSCLVLLFVVVSTRALRGGALLEELRDRGVRRPGEGRHAEPTGARDARPAAPDVGGAEAVHGGWE